MISNERRVFALIPPKVKIESRNKPASTIADVLDEESKEGENPLEWIQNNREEAIAALGLKTGISYFAPHDLQGGWVQYVRVLEHRVNRFACNATRPWDPLHDRIIVNAIEKK